MDNYIDEVFGDLVYDEGLSTKIDINIFSKISNVRLYLAVDEISEISEGQKKAFIAFKNNQKNLLKQIEIEVILYCKNNYDDETNVNIFNKIKLSTISIRMFSKTNKRVIGFVFDTDFDSEMGIGVVLENEKIRDVGTQHVAC